MWRVQSGGRRAEDGAFLCAIVVLGKQIATETYGALGDRTTEVRVRASSVCMCECVCVRVCVRARAR